MSSKKGASNAYMYNQRNIDKMIDIIDKRSKSGKDRENVDPVWKKHRINKKGDRVWTF